MVNGKVWQIYDDIGSTACHTGNYVLAQRMFTLALETCDGDKTMLSNRVKSLVGLADACVQQAQFDQATILYKRVLNMLARISIKTESQRWILIHVLEKLGYIYADQGNNPEALKLLRRSVREGESLLGKAHPALVRPLLKISLLHVYCGQVDSSIEELNRAKNIQSIYDPSTS